MRITVEDNVRAVADLARRTYGEIDLWFSNAGFAGPRQPGDIQANALWDSTWKLHAMSHVYAVRQVIPSMLDWADGYLLQTASVVALSTQPEKAAYSVTKHAALALAEWLAVAYRPERHQGLVLLPRRDAAPKKIVDSVGYLGLSGQ